MTWCRCPECNAEAGIECAVSCPGGERRLLAQIEELLSKAPLPRPTDADLARWKLATAGGGVSAFARCIRILIAEVERLRGSEQDAKRRFELLKRVATYAVIDPVGIPYGGHRMRGLEVEIEAECSRGPGGPVDEPPKSEAQGEGERRPDAPAAPLDAPAGHREEERELAGVGRPALALGRAATPLERARTLPAPARGSRAAPDKAPFQAHHQPPGARLGLSAKCLDKRAGPCMHRTLATHQTRAAVNPVTKPATTQTAISATTSQRVRLTRR